jgi:hypothetical protein
VLTCGICCGFLVYLAILLQSESASQWQVPGAPGCSAAVQPCGRES